MVEENIEQPQEQPVEAPKEEAPVQEEAPKAEPEQEVKVEEEKVEDEPAAEPVEQKPAEPDVNPLDEIKSLKDEVVELKAQIKKLEFGYSDKVSIFLNRRILFTGDSSFRSRDPLFLGVAGLNDAVYLPLQKGENELLLIVSESMGGWGFISRLTDR